MTERNGELFPDAEAIRETLARRTREALLKRHGPAAAPPDAPLPPTADPAVRDAERRTARGLGFGLDLVRAILAGRKTQTRRLIRPQPPADITPPAADCPAALVGELLYVREPWRRDGEALRYAADEPAPTGRRYRPGMYMPRDAARLWLRVTAVRAERLRAMSAADLAAEGLPAGRSFAAVWDGFYGDAGQRWADDPWVWVISFAAEN